MEEVKSFPKTEDDAAAEEAAQMEIWKYAFGFVPMAVVKCAINLGIANVLESHGGAMTLSALASALGCSPPILHRIMRYLVHRGIFKMQHSLCYEQTPLSRLIMRQGEENITLAPFVLLHSSPMMLAPWHNLSARTLIAEDSAFKAAHRCDLWKYAEANPAENNLFNEGMACHARLGILAILKCCPEAFEGVGSLVDVGGGNGTTLRTLIKACPWIQGINLDVPHVVAEALPSDGIEQVSGDMFLKIPSADVAFLMGVLHDWGDEECIHILRNCGEAISMSCMGKVMIAEAVIEEDESGNNAYEDAHLNLDMVMLTHTETGKERTAKEWDHVIKAAGFTRFTIKQIPAAIFSLIEVYP